MLLGAGIPSGMCSLPSHERKHPHITPIVRLKAKKKGREKHGREEEEEGEEAEEEEEEEEESL